MKKLYILILFVSIFTSAFCQKEQVYIQFSPISYNNLNVILGKNQRFKTDYNPSFELTLSYRFNNLILGVNTKYSLVNYKEYQIVNTTNTVDFSANSLSSIFKVDYNYYQGKKMNLYSGLGLGLSTYRVYPNNIESDFTLNKNISKLDGFAYQIDILGLNYQLTKTFGVYSIIGYGTNGLAQFGLSVNLKN